MRGFNSQHKFLSTPSARRATGDVVSAQHIVDISIHALREEGDDDPADDRIPIVVISIHALREEGDLMMLCSSVSAILFLSTPSARRATRAEKAAEAAREISIHALREEGDRRASAWPRS